MPNSLSIIQHSSYLLTAQRKLRRTEDMGVVHALAIQQSLGLIACRKETLMTQLNYHKELTSKLKSVKYLHILREFNAAADSLATEALESKTSKVVLDESRKLELAGLNRIREVIYDSGQSKTEVKPVAEDPNHEHNRSKPFADFFQIRVRFADDSEATIPKPMSTEDTENAPVNPTKTGANALRTVPDTSDVDPVAIQTAQRRKIAQFNGHYQKETPFYLVHGWLGCQFDNEGDADVSSTRSSETV
ncbi:hypothetical protein PHMEG_00017017 [Phytophthora megakarya]|uniref:RNase H type-1 domain-containing protein n=1 Tax=Phytophthora megakarya TaxID=4795 RepID=A0A225VZ42_9STRA|nr:hypothetical protein PHMEG_00017017 [Phytophthora megakarya]